MRHGNGFNEGEVCFILSWFVVHQSILHSWGDISVLLLLWQCSWGFSSVPSGKSRFLTPLIGNKELLSTKCRGIGLILLRGGCLMSFLELRQAPGVYSRVTALMSIRNWSLFSEVRTPVCLWGTTQEYKLGMAGQYGRFWMLSGSSGLFFYLTEWYWDS